MSSDNLPLPPIPSSLKPISHFIKLAAEHENRDPILTYYARLASLQKAMKLDKTSKEALSVIMTLMDWCEKEKKVLSTNESIVSEVVASAHIENYAMKLFNYADSNDRNEQFNKNVVKAFYSTGVLFDIEEILFESEFSDESSQVRKYAKWKAAYIHNCLKNGETPMPGPQGEEEEIKIPNRIPDTPIQPSDVPSIPEQPAVIPSMIPDAVPESSGSKDTIEPAVAMSVKKYCKYASNACDFDDKNSAIDSLTKALELLKN